MVKLTTKEKIILDSYLNSLLTKKPIKTGLTKEEMIKFISEDDLKLYVMMLDDDTIVIHKLRDKK